MNDTVAFEMRREIATKMESSSSALRCTINAVMNITLSGTEMKMRICVTAA